MKTRAAVAFEAKRPLEIVELDLEGPRAGEVLVEIKATGICHTDAYTLDGLDSEGLFPSILGHEGAGVVAVVNTADVEAGANCIVFGLGGIGLNVIQGLKMVGAGMIVGVDLNPEREAWGRRFGMTHFVNP